MLSRARALRADCEKTFNDILNMRVCEYSLWKKLVDEKKKINKYNLRVTLIEKSVSSFVYRVRDRFECTGFSRDPEWTVRTAIYRNDRIIIIIRM